MADATQPRWAVLALATAAIATAIAVGVQLRLEDPLSSPVLPAEDPYNHMALVREHLRDGNLDPLNPGGRLYPPGMHALLAAAASYSGIDLYQIMRLGPTLLGAIGILGMALLLHRFEGPIAAFVGALAFAVAPEAILRTTMMAPTALDLALLPFLLYALLEVLRGRLAWAGVAATLCAYLVFAHPWILTIVALAGAVFTVAALAMPWPASRGPPLSPRGFVATVAIVGVAWSLAVWGCAGACGPGFGEILPQGDRLSAFAPLIAGAALLPALILRLAPHSFDWVSRKPAPRPSLTAPRAVAAACVALVLVLVTVPAINQGMPSNVNLPVMFGWPILLMAAFALVLLPFIPSPASHMGAAILATTYPFVIYNAFDSPFWSHRTAVYLGAGLVMLTGVAAGALARAAVHAVVTRKLAFLAAPRQRARPAFAVMAGLLVAASLGGTVYAATPTEDQTGWYRLYDACELEGLRQVAQAADADPTALIVAGAWQPKLVLAALTTDASRVWFKADFFTSPPERDKMMADKSRAVFVIVDDYLAAQKPKPDPSFLWQPPWQEIGRWCAPPAASSPTLFVYRAGADR